MPAERTQQSNAALRQTTLPFSDSSSHVATKPVLATSSNASAERIPPLKPLQTTRKTTRPKEKLKVGDENRVFTDAILSIKPEFTQLISKRRKNHEYRKYKLKESVTRLWLYETAPTSAIT